MFEHCITLEELKREYHKAAISAHPDNGGSTEQMQIVNAAYTARFDAVRRLHRNRKGETYDTDTDETAAEFVELIRRLMEFPGIKAEILGSFIWLSGDTKPVKEELKSMGFRWSPNKSQWYKSPKNYRKTSRGDWTIDEIRNTFAQRGTSESNTTGQLLLS